MTQQPYYPPAQPQFPAQPASQQYQQPYAPQPVQQAPQYAQPQYQQPYPAQQAPAPQGPPPAQGSLDQFYSQPSAASGPSISWSVNGQQKPLGTSYAGIVARDVIDSDVQQDSDPKTGQLKTYRDGRPKFFMKVPLKVQPSPEFPEGEATWYVRGQSRDELARAMAEAGVSGSPKGGDALSITLVDRRPSRGGGMPANIVQVRYQAANGQQGGTGAPSPAPEQQAPAQQPQYAPPVQMPAYGGGQPIAPQQFQQAPVQQPVAPSQPIQQQVPAQQPVPQQGQLQVPPDFNSEQAALLARITGQQPGQVPA